MAVIQTLKGVIFNNPALPVLQQYIMAGLVGGYRVGTFSADMSPAGNDLISTGDPVEGDSYVTANYNNYFDTGINLPDEFTLIAVFRAASTPASNIFAVGDYSTGPIEGVGLFTRPTGKSAASAMSSVDGVLIGNKGKPTNDSLDFAWQALTSDGGVVRWMVPKVDFNYSESYAGVLKAGAGTIKIGRANTTMVGTESHDIVEILIYDRALSVEELLEQYEYSSQFALGLGIAGI